MKSIKSTLQELSYSDLREWAGSKIYARGKDYVDNVSQLSQAEDGTLVAWVSGTDEYATRVRHKGDGNFDYDCTCPYNDWGPCKHVVAVLLAAAGELKKNLNIPPLDPDSDLYLEIFEEDHCMENEDDDWQGRDDSTVVQSKGRSPRLEKLLADKSRDELQALLIELALDFPEVSRRLHDSAKLEDGQIDQLVRSLRKEIRNLTAEDVWYNPWKDEGNLPDYSHVEDQLRALLDKGYADAVLDLGEELWPRGLSQIEASHDDGETAIAISTCMDIVMSAVPLTSLSTLEQLLWLIEHELEDEYSLLDGMEAVLGNESFTRAHWREVAGVFETRLATEQESKIDDFSARYQRRKIMDRLRDAYVRGGEMDKIIPLLEREVDRCQNYEPLVTALIDAGELERARQWCIEGFNRTIKAAPGIADGLQKRLRLLAVDEGRFDLAAAYLAENFFDRPSENSYIELREAVEKLDAWPGVRIEILNYLKTGRRSQNVDKGKKVWPLPEPEVKKPKSGDKFSRIDFPNRNMLIEIAILEQRFDDAVALYQELNKNRFQNQRVNERLATAIAGSHPDIALKIWSSTAEGLIAQVKPKAYREAAPYLSRMRKLYENTNRFDEWKAFVLALRTRHKAKRKLMEVLDDLNDNRKLID